MTTLGFEDYVELLKVYLQKFRDMEGEKTVLAGRQAGDRDSGNGCVVNSGNNGGEFQEGYHHQGDTGRVGIIKWVQTCRVKLVRVIKDPAR